MVETAYNRTTIEIGDEATILIENLGPREILHEDLGLITITAPTASEAVSKAAYVGGYPVTWTNTCRIGGGVDFWYTADGGAEWAQIADDETDDGAYTWAIAGLANGEYVLRIQMNEDNTVFAERHLTIGA